MILTPRTPKSYHSPLHPSSPSTSTPTPPLPLKHLFAYKRAAIVGHCVTKDVQGLHLATFHSMTAVGIPLVVEGH